jgi:NitT/TauT family transport system substrate-binding protein
MSNSREKSDLAAEAAGREASKWSRGATASPSIMKRFCRACSWNRVWNACLGMLGGLLILFHTVHAFAADAERFRVSLLPQWIPQAQFAGYMVAQDKGFYRDAGLDLTLMRGGPENPALEMLRKGEATFCISWLSTAARSRAEGVPLVNIGQIVQRSALLLVAKKSTGIKAVSDLHGKNIGCWEGDFRIQPLALFRIHDLTVRLVPMYSTTNLFLKGGVSAMAAMWYNEYHTILNSGLDPGELTLLFFSELGLNFPEDGLYCLEDTCNAHPEVCTRLVEASLRGWLYAFDHQDEALDIVMKHADAASTGTNRAHQRWMLARMKDLILPDGDRAGLGNLREKDYDRVTEVLKDLKLIEHVPRFGEFYRGPK